MSFTNSANDVDKRRWRQGALLASLGASLKDSYHPRHVSGLAGARKLIAVFGLLLVGCSTVPPTPAQVPASADASHALVAALPPGARVKQLALGNYHTCALLESGRVACWGDNGMGQLGNGSDRSSALPVLVPHVLDATEVRANRATTCVRETTGAVSCWGDNGYGQANPKFDAALKSAPTPWGAYDNDGPVSFSPANVLRLATPNVAATGAQGLSLGYGHGCALYRNGRIRCWGDASQGQLGVGPARDAFQVQSIAGLPRLVEIASDVNYSCGRTAGGDVWCWGANGQGQLGSLRPGPDPRQVSGVTGAVELLLANNRACARLEGGKAICWGSSLDCGGGRALPPTPADELENEVQFARAAGGCFWCVLHSDHELSCDGDTISEVHFSMPRVATVTAGDTHACAARFDGSVWCWGNNSRGELGRKTSDMRHLEPAPVLWPDEILQIPTQ